MGYHEPLVACGHIPCREVIGPWTGTAADVVVAEELEAQLDGLITICDRSGLPEVDDGHARGLALDLVPECVQRLVGVHHKDLEVDELARGELPYLVDAHRPGWARGHAIDCVERPRTRHDIILDPSRNVGPGVAKFGAGWGVVGVAAKI